MNDLIVVSGITHREHLIDEYESQLTAAEIDHYFHPVELANATYSITARWKLNFIREACENFYRYDRIIISDAWDVYFFGSKDELMPKIPAMPLISAERNCYPDPTLAHKIHGMSPWRYANAGMVSGEPSHLIHWAMAALETPDIDGMEQEWLNRRLAAADFPIRLDSLTSVFYTVSPDREGGALWMKNGKPYNTKFDTYPQFFHFSGRCPTEPFRAMLEGRLNYLENLSDNPAVAVPD